MTDSKLEKAALRGEPSYVWRAGQARRLDMILQATGDLISGKVLDNGCGVGSYLKHLSQHTNQTYGVEIEFERALKASEQDLKVACAAAENLPYPNGHFDLILSHEVLEHVENDRQSLEEMARILRPPNAETGHPGGRLLLFLPNRGYPFETHGFYWKGNYHFGNIPLLNYLPRILRDRYAPHVRIYSTRDLKRLTKGLPLRIVHRTIIFGAYDNLIARWPALGRILRGLLQFLEHTPLRVLGLSHFWILERTEYRPPSIR